LTFIIDIQRAFSDKDLQKDFPSDKAIKSIITTVLTKFRSNGELSIRIVNPDEIQDLNKRYRHKDKPTNVLSFPMDLELPDGIDLPHELLGDIVIAADIIKQEAIEQKKSFISHFTHILIHGTLHLLGFDHINNDDAKIMEDHEINIMQELNFANPYKN